MNENITGKFREMSRKNKIIFIVSLLLTIANISIITAWAWFSNKRSMERVILVDKPQIIYITAGHEENIMYLDISDINVLDFEKDENGDYKYSSGGETGGNTDEGGETGEDEKTDRRIPITTKRFVFGIKGKDKEDSDGSTIMKNYDLQIAHTQNIAFEYKLYRAREATKDDLGVLLKYELHEKKADENLSYVYYDKSSDNLFDKNNSTDIKNAYGEYVCKGTTVDAEFFKEYTYKKEDSTTSYDKVRKKSYPKYEQLLNIPTGISENSSDKEFTHYYILELDWKEAREQGRISNNKETDIICITVDSST